MIGFMTSLPLLNLFGSYKVLCDETDARLNLAASTMICSTLFSLDYMINYTQLSMKQYWSDIKCEYSMTFNRGSCEKERKSFLSASADMDQVSVCGSPSPSLFPPHPPPSTPTLPTPPKDEEKRKSVLSASNAEHTAVHAKKVKNDGKCAIEDMNMDSHTDIDDNYKITSLSTYPERIIQWTISKKRTVKYVQLGISVSYTMIRALIPLSSCMESDTLLYLIIFVLYMAVVILLYWATRYGSNDTLGMRKGLIATVCVSFVILALGTIFTYGFRFPITSKMRSITNASSVGMLLAATMYYPLRIMLERKYDHNQKTISTRPSTSSLSSSKGINTNNTTHGGSSSSHPLTSATATTATTTTTSSLETDQTLRRLSPRMVQQGQLFTTTTTTTTTTTLSLPPPLPLPIPSLSPPPSPATPFHLVIHSRTSSSATMSTASVSTHRPTTPITPKNTTARINNLLPLPTPSRKIYPSKPKISSSIDPVNASKYETVFYDTRLQNEFHAFLKGEFSCENLLFEKAVRKYKRLKETNVESLKLYAQEIYDLYISIDSNLQVNLSSSVAKPIHEMFQREGRRTKTREIWQNIFNAAVEEIHHMVEKDSWSRFLMKRTN
jgi:hypothetical protein